MAAISLPVGNVLVPWIGPATTLVGQPWFTSANLSAVYRVSANRAGYISNIPGSSFPAFSQVIPTAPGQVPDAYIFAVTTAFSLDSSLIGSVVAGVTRLVATFPAGVTASVSLKVTQSEQVGSYVPDASLPATGLTNLVYSKGGTVIPISASQPVALALNDTLVVTGQTAVGVEGVLTFVKQ